MTAVTERAGYQSPQPQLLAERARTARTDTTCCLCPRPVAEGQRVADVVGVRGLAHLVCAARLTDGEQR